MAENKVQFGLKNCYYAVMTPGTTPTFATPVKIPGGVNLNLNASGEISKFYADNMIYFQSDDHAGYDGSIEFARIPDVMRKDVFGMTEGSTSHVLTEKSSDSTKPIALLFQIDGDDQEELYVLYNVACSRPGIASGTIQGTKEPVTASINISAAPLPNGKIFARTTGSTATTVRSGWFSAVWQEA